MEVIRSMVWVRTWREACGRGRPGRVGSSITSDGADSKPAFRSSNFSARRVFTVLLGDVLHLLEQDRQASLAAEEFDAPCLEVGGGGDGLQFGEGLFLELVQLVEHRGKDKVGDLGGQIKRRRG
jgi:hypothetical protein